MSRVRRAFCYRCDKPRDGSHHTYCRVCYNDYSRGWDIANAERVAAIQARKNLRSNFGIEPEDKARILAAQGGVCGCCGTSEPDGKYGWVLDHDHEHGHIRGVLCNGCNLRLGHYRDDPPAHAEHFRAYVDRTRVIGYVAPGLVLAEA